MKKWMISLLSVLALALAFSGCGGSEGSSSSATVTNTQVTVEDTTPEQPVVAVGTGVNADEVAKTDIENQFGPIPAVPN